MQDNRPVDVTGDRAQRLLIINWSDGHESRYSFDGLRQACPCVECRGGHAHMGQPPDARQIRNAPDTGLALESVEAVGAYALQFTWGNGHSTGIYSWEWLRSACPCAECLVE
ncbi:MAG: DUF971 domain-containing protein [Chloroflexota bacterium]|nr:MAG: DUF971 domain-containing protein [Chloroflexota bacterium]